MNIYTQCCGIAILIVLLIFYNFNNQLKLDIGTAFIRIMVCSLISQLFDIISVIGLAHIDICGELVVKILCKAYLVSMMFMMSSCLIYLLHDIYADNKVRYIRISRVYVLTVVGIILICILPINLYSDTVNNIYYTSGLAAIATYGFAGIIMAILFYHSFLTKEKLNPDRRIAINVWLLLWVLSCIIQILRKDILIVSFAGTLGVLILYLKMENPEIVKDKKNGMLNRIGLDKYIFDLYSNHKKFGFARCSYEHQLSRISEYSEKSEILKEIFTFFKKLENVKVFRNSDYEILLVFENNDNMEETLDLLKMRFENTWGKEKIDIIPDIVSIPKAYQMEDLNEIFCIIKHAAWRSSDYVEKKYIEINDEIISVIRNDIAMEQEVKLAMKEDRIEVFCQPIYSNKESRYTTGEALVRIRKKDGGYIYPNDFIELIENNGDIIKVGRIVFEKICQFIKVNGLEEYGFHYLEVNLSMVQCADRHLATDYLTIMRKYDIDPKLVNLEITESASMNSKKLLLSNMKRLMDYGVTFSLDDFGTGLSNLNYIAEMPVSVVKFDKTMTQAYFEDEKTKYILDAAIHMINGLGLEIVAEGVETKEQYETLREMGISYIQGYYFSKPVPLLEFFTIMKHNKIVQ